MIGVSLGSYQVTRLLGGGGMGVVYAAEHKTIGRRVAIKVLLPEYSHNHDMVSRIFNEARAAALIEHPGIVDVYDCGHHSDGSAYIVMEMLEGENLAAFLHREDRVSVELVAALGRQIASALGAAHDKGIVHRDLKPDNVFLVRDDETLAGIRAKVLDFGIAKLAGGQGALKTSTGMLMGTPIYMSPEQCRGAGAVDHRADIYALGCILYEMVCGRPPFEAEGVGEIIAAHLYAEPTPPGELEPTVPPWLEQLVMRALAKRPEARPQSMHELAAELGGRAVRTLSANARTLTPVPWRPTTLSRAASELRVEQPARRRPRPIWALLAASLLGLAGVVFALTLGHHSDRVTAARAPLPVAAPRPPDPPVSPPSVRPPDPPPRADVVAELTEAPDAGVDAGTDFTKPAGEKPAGKRPPGKKAPGKPHDRTLDPFAPTRSSR